MRASARSIAIAPPSRPSSGRLHSPQSAMKRIASLLAIASVCGPAIPGSALGVLMSENPRVVWYNDNDTSDTSWQHGTSYRVSFHATISQRDVDTNSLSFEVKEADSPASGDDPIYSIVLPCTALYSRDVGKDVSIHLGFCVQCAGQYGLLPAGLEDYEATWDCSLCRGLPNGTPGVGEPYGEGEGAHELVLVDEAGARFGQSMTDCFECNLYGPNCSSYQYWWTSMCTNAAGAAAGPDPVGEARTSTSAPAPMDAPQPRPAGDPVRSSPGGGASNPITGSRDVCWSEPADLGGGKLTSERICAFGLQSEIANDFEIERDATITKAIGYGGYYDWSPGDPEATAYNLRFYADAGCVPAALLEGYDHDPGAVTFIGYDGNGFPTYKLEFLVNFEAEGGTTYWFALQADDHPFPPQWGRQQAVWVTNCDSMFRSEFFGYPEWTYAGEFGPWDASQEFECAEPVAAERTSWGLIKALYR